MRHRSKVHILKMYILQNIKEFCSDFFGVACFPDDLAVVALGLDPSFTTFNNHCMKIPSH